MMLSRKPLWTMDKTLESTMKAGINTEFPTCDDKGVFTMIMAHIGNASRWPGGWEMVRRALSLIIKCYTVYGYRIRFLHDT
jgi:hypothetical protein